MDISQVCLNMGVIEPKIGQKMYIQSSYFIDNGYNDVSGGLATIEEIKFRYIRENPINSIMVKFKEINGHTYNYIAAMIRQKELKSQYNGRVAKNDPE